MQTLISAKLYWGPLSLTRVTGIPCLKIMALSALMIVADVVQLLGGRSFHIN